MESVGWRLLRTQQKMAGTPSAPFTAIILSVMGAGFLLATPIRQSLFGPTQLERILEKRKWM
jgi:hypothetical protein